jgi:2-polyprenyl-3-methyl-5-hydroxy-6-metoxy-1,4-benzoquinol methylase
LLLERVVPGETGGKVYLEHLGRYEFASQFVPGMRILDVACGVGYGAPILCSIGARTYLGVDISAEAVAIAEGRYRLTESISFMLRDACSLESIGEATIDVVISFETIEHLADPMRFLAELRRVLVPGGILIISTPNRTLFNPLGNLSSMPANPFHIREWNKSEFTQLLGSFFMVEKVLGQVPHHYAHAYWKYWKALILRQATKHGFLQWLVRKYRAAGFLRERSSLPEPAHDVSVPVQPVKPWQCQTYIVCVCTRLPALQSGRKAPPRRGKPA